MLIWLKLESNAVETYFHDFLEMVNFSFFFENTRFRASFSVHFDMFTSHRFLLYMSSKILKSNQCRSLNHDRCHSNNDLLHITHRCDKCSYII